MSRIQLALNVDDLDAAIDFYTTLFGTPPAKRHDGYANFAVADPPLKLVLFESPGNGGTLNHLGVEVATPAEVAQATERLTGAGLATDVRNATTCCYATQDKVWVGEPGNGRWEVYTVLADAPVLEPAGPTCCA
jgi:lactoylglutathione lyase